MKQSKHKGDPQRFQKTVMAGVALLLVATMVLSFVASMLVY